MSDDVFPHPPVELIYVFQFGDGRRKRFHASPDYAPTLFESFRELPHGMSPLEQEIVVHHDWPPMTMNAEEPR